MRLHWTNPTIIRRPTIAALSAAALLVACDQPAGPSRPGGHILADAQAGTVSAHGHGQVAIAEECTTTSCAVGGQGADFSFAFSGEPAATGTFSVKFRETGDVAEFVSGSALIQPDEHALTVGGECTLTTTAGVIPGACSLVAVDFAQPNSGDLFNFYFNGGMASADSPVISGGMQID